MKDFDYEQMLAGELYLAKFIQDENKSYHGQRLAQQINQVDIRNKEEIIRLEKQLFGSTGTYIYATPPVYVDFGRHVHIGENFYANTGCVFLDTTTITIGENVMLAPRVGLYTAGHPIDSDIIDKEYWEKKKANYFEARKKIEEI